jgi:phage-related protein
MGSLSVASVLEKNRIESDVPLLVALDIEVIDPSLGTYVETLRIVRNSEQITFGGNPYQPAIFDISFASEASAISNVSLSISDFTGAIQARMEEYGGGVGFNITMHVVNAGNLTQGSEVSEFFTVMGANAKDYKASFTLGADSDLLKTFPRRRQTKDFCQWRYKDPETCKYSGALSKCDLSLQGPNGCAAHGNTINFGAFPGLNSNGFRYA